VGDRRPDDHEDRNRQQDADRGERAPGEAAQRGAMRKVRSDHGVDRDVRRRAGR
jgi:hypothetical protein